MKKSKMNSPAISFLFQKRDSVSELIQNFNNDSILVTDGLTKDQMVLIKEMTANGSLLKITNRIFVDSEWSLNDFLLRQLVLKQGIYSGVTALYLWGLTDEFPYELSMTFRMGYRLPRTYGRWTDNVIARQTQPSDLNKNVSLLAVDGTNYKIKLYSRERTLVDILREPYLIGDDLIEIAYKRYLDSKGADKNFLLEIAYSMGLLNKVRMRLERY